MKKIVVLIAAALMLFGCNYGERFNLIEDRLDLLETKVDELNDITIPALQSIVKALQNKVYVSSVLTENDGYSIIFTDGTIARIKDGEDGTDGKDGIDGKDGTDGKDGIDGKDGLDGKDGADGKDGHSPVVSVVLDADGNYYWTVDGELIYDDEGSKLPVNITPIFKIEEGYWYVSYDNGITYTWLGQATGEDGKDGIDGKDGEDGDSLFASVVEKGKYVYITLANGTEFMLEKYAEEVKLLSLLFKAEHNPSALIENLKAEIQDNICECMIPHMVQDKTLIPVFEISGKSVSVNDSEVISGVTELDFSKPVRLDVIGAYNDTVSYVVNVRAFTGLPIININTENGVDITSKETYVKAKIKIVEDITTKASGDVFESSVRIKGRGNSTWNRPKKPYKLKFDEKVSLFGEPKDKEWVLLANYMDYTQIRNELAMFMGEKSSLSYTCRTHYAEVFLNNIYIGTYQVAEQQKISKDRVNVTDEGFLIEIDSKPDAEDITFRLGSIGQPLNIKDPDVEVGSDHYNYIVNFMTQVESALYGENWLDEENGWKKYMDMDSFVDWYLINEISRNNDAVFFTSCYMHHAPGGKLYMGPLWDYDLAFGNTYMNSSYNPEGFYIKDNTSWYVRLFSDPAFVARVKERFQAFYDLKDVFLNEINANARYLELSAIENNNKWGTLYTSHLYAYSVMGSYYNEVNYLKNWFSNRMEWLKSAYEKL